MKLYENRATTIKACKQRLMDSRGGRGERASVISPPGIFPNANPASCNPCNDSKRDPIHAICGTDTVRESRNYTDHIQFVIQTRSYHHAKRHTRDAFWDHVSKVVTPSFL